MICCISGRCIKNVPSFVQINEIILIFFCMICVWNLCCFILTHTRHYISRMNGYNLIYSLNYHHWVLLCWNNYIISICCVKITIHIFYLKYQDNHTYNTIFSKLQHVASRSIKFDRFFERFKCLLHIMELTITSWYIKSINIPAVKYTLIWIVYCI